MIPDLVSRTGELVHGNPWMAVVAVFLGGMLTASNPCVMAMVPLTVGLVAGRREHGQGGLRAFGYSLVFVLGLGMTFTVLGFLAALAGRMYGETSSIWSYTVAVVCLLMGLQLMGVLEIPISIPIQAPARTRGVLGALVLGMLFGGVSAPCAAPILVVLLTYLAAPGASLAYGALLLMVYGLGHSALLLVAGTSMGFARRLLESSRWAHANTLMRKVAGALVLAAGAWFLLEDIL